MDKVQKIREEVVRLKSQLLRGACSSQVAMETRCKEEAYNEVLAIIDSLQEEPVSEEWIEELRTKLDSMSKENFKKVFDKYAIDFKEEPVSEIDFEQELYKAFGQVKDFTLGMRIAKWFSDMGKNSQEPVSEELEEASLEYFKQALKDGDKTKLDAFKAGANWQKAKDESTTEDLGEYINELSKQFPEVSFAKLSRIAVRVAKWQKEQMKNTLEPDTPATAEEIKKMQDKRRYELEKKVQHEYNSQLQEQYDNGYDDGYKDAEKVAYEKVRQQIIDNAIE